MDAKLRAKLKGWPERYDATMSLVRATEAGDLKKTIDLLSQFPLLDYWAPYNARGWSQIAAAAGQVDLMEFWHSREMKTRPVRMRASPESLLFWAIGSEYVNSIKGDPA